MARLAHWATMFAWLCRMKGEEVDLVEASFGCGNEQWKIPWILDSPRLRLSLQLLGALQRDECQKKQCNRDFPTADCPSYRSPAMCQSRGYERERVGKRG